MFYWDQNIALYLDFQFGSSLDKAANRVTWLGLADLYFYISILGYASGLLAEKYFHQRINRESSRKIKKQFKLMFYSFLVSGLLAVLLKVIIGRCRPYHSPVFDPLYFKPLSLHWNFQSYPSGHSQVSFTLASFLVYLWPKHAPYFYILAGVIALSRVILDYHFLGDVIFGSYVGILGFYLTLKMQK
jgi:membrane-associated phospholipid phosphatase